MHQCTEQFQHAMHGSILVWRMWVLIRRRVLLNAILNDWQRKMEHRSEKLFSEMTLSIILYGGCFPSILFRIVPDDRLLEDRLLKRKCDILIAS